MGITGSDVQANRIGNMERLAPNNPYFPFVTVDPDRLSGEPVFRGTRVLVSSLFDYLRAGYDLETFLDHFDGVSQAQAEGVLSLASQDAVAALRAA